MPRAAIGSLVGLALVVGLTSSACSQGRSDDIVRSEALDLSLETVADGLDHPWSLVFLPDGRMLVSERPGRLRIVTADGAVSEPLAGVPPVDDARQGGLLDLELHPDFANNRLVYFTFSEPGEGGTNGTAVARARLIADGAPRLEDVEVIFRQQPKVRSTAHFGSRLRFDADGLLWVSLGERARDQFRVMAQDLDNHLGKIVRLTGDGAPAPGNPFVDQAGALPEIFSYGHRNPQGMAVHPETGAIWIHEHGPRGGDEVNIPVAGGNFGWPEFSYGTEYSGRPITRLDRHPPEFVEATYVWTPSIAPSGMAFYDGDAIAAWQGSLLVGALAHQKLVRLELDGDRVTHQEDLLTDYGWRIRDVRVGPDGLVYLLTDAANGRLVRLAPAD